MFANRAGRGSRVKENRRFSVKTDVKTEWSVRHITDPFPSSEAVYFRNEKADLMGSLIMKLIGMRLAAFGFALAVTVGALAPGSLLAQENQAASPLTLQQAVNIALEKNPQRKAAIADTKAASAEVRDARSFLLPHLTFSETAMSGDDPVFVFGSKLRQRRFTPSDFALNVLNTPTPFGDFTTRFGGTWNLFDSLASWRAVNRAERAKDAAGHALEGADQEIIFHVIDSYYGVLLAKKQLEVAEQAVKTAQSVLDRSKDRFESGVVVESDYLSAQVRMAARKQELIRAQDNLALAKAQLSTAMGISTEDAFDTSEALAEKIFLHWRWRMSRSKRWKCVPT